MGTRAIITKDSKPFIATHWNGYPDCLGKDLIATKTDEDIIKEAEKHTIDNADKSILLQLNKERYKHIASKTNGKYSAEDIAKLHKQGKELTFGVMSAGDYPICDISEYDDWAEYQYDLTNKVWQFRELSGSWKEDSKSNQFYPLSKDGINKWKIVQRMEG